MSASGARASSVPFMLHAGLAALLAAVASPERVQGSEEMEGEGRGCGKNSFGKKKKKKRANAGISK